jgi:hypothetical protein
MEIKISISDAAGAVVSGPSAPAPLAASAPPPAAAEGGVSDGGQAGGAQPGATMGAQQMGGAPAAVLARAAATGAIDAGRAPDLGGLQAGAPPPFITGLGASRMAMGATAAPAESAGAAPGSEARVLTSTAPESGGGA